MPHSVQGREGPLLRRDFYPGEPVLGTMRLNFSHASPEQAERGLATLASLLRARETPVPSSKG